MLGFNNSAFEVPILQAVAQKKNIHIINDYFSIRFAALTGLRISEITNLKISDIAESSIRVIGKGKKLRIVPIGPRGRAVKVIAFGF